MLKKKQGEKDLSIEDCARALHAEKLYSKEELKTLFELPINFSFESKKRTRESIDIKNNEPSKTKQLNPDM